MSNTIKKELFGSLIIVILVAGIILFIWHEISTQPGNIQPGLSKTEINTTNANNTAIIPTTTQPDLSKIKINLREGDYLFDGKIFFLNESVIGESSQYTWSIIDSKILLLNYSLNYTTLKKEDVCLPDSANPGDSGIVIRETLKNEYDRDYWITLGAAAYDSNENLLGRSLDSGPICGIIARHVESNITENLELHLKYNNTISRINISGSISEVCPP